MEFFKGKRTPSVIRRISAKGDEVSLCTQGKASTFDRSALDHRAKEQLATAIADWHQKKFVGFPILK